ncbi:hypothetical protein H6F77_20900 [Microcoleus sp. FACHB-831]|nr:hypothetical protein [Microcoleus sp. FACHB-831]
MVITTTSVIGSVITTVVAAGDGDGLAVAPVVEAGDGDVVGTTTTVVEAGDGDVVGTTTTVVEAGDGDGLGLTATGDGLGLTATGDGLGLTTTTSGLFDDWSPQAAIAPATSASIVTLLIHARTVTKLLFFFIVFNPLCHHAFLVLLEPQGHFLIFWIDLDRLTLESFRAIALPSNGIPNSVDVVMYENAL